MKRVLVAYFSATGTTEKMAQYIAEGIRFSGQQAVVREIKDIKTSPELAGYDGYIFGSPTYSLDLPGPVKAFLATADNSGLAGKLCGTFGSYTHDIAYKHDNFAPAILFDTLQRECRMMPFELGPFIMKEELVETSEGMKNCQTYGRVFGEKLNNR